MYNQPDDYKNDEDCTYINFQSKGLNDLACYLDYGGDFDMHGLCEIKVHTNCIVKNNMFDFN